MMHEGSNRARRGLRCTLPLPVRFRAAGDSAWYTGTTEDVSRSGVMIRAGCAPAADCAVDVLIVLPASGGEWNGCLRARGRVARKARPNSSAGATRFAVTVARYRLEPLDRALETLA